MTEFDDPFSADGFGEGLDETTFAQGRSPDRLYVSRSFEIDRANSSDLGQPARFIHKVFDTDGETAVEFDGTEWLVAETPKGRYQVKLMIAREAGRVKELWVQRVPAAGTPGGVKLLLNLRAPAVQRLVELLRNLEHVPIDGDSTVRIDDSLIREVFSHPDALVSVYRQDQKRFRELISSDESAADVIALAHRRAQVHRFHRFLDDDDFFDEAVAAVPAQRPEAVWQGFFEENPWILGMSLSGQLLTSWDSNRLEQVVAGRSIAGVGKRSDALLQTSGRIRSMVFAEFKTHRTDLLSSEYRSGCWSPSPELVGGVAQVQGTVHRAATAIGERLGQQDTDGTERLGEFAYLLRPKSFLIVGQLAEFIGESGGHHLDKLRSFELYRKQLVEPEVMTFDELLARADWLVSDRAGDSGS